MRHAARHLDSAGHASSIYRLGALEVDLPGRRVAVHGSEIKLTKLEFDLLAALARNAGKVVTHRQLLKDVWGPQAVNEPHYVRVFIASLRKKLEKNPARPELLLTEQGVGYRLLAERED